MARNLVTWPQGAFYKTVEDVAAGTGHVATLQKQMQVDFIIRACVLKLKINDYTRHKKPPIIEASMESSVAICKFLVHMVLLGFSKTFNIVARCSRTLTEPPVTFIRRKDAFTCFCSPTFMWVLMYMNIVAII